MELQNALSHQSARDQPVERNTLTEVAAFIHQEEEGLVLDERPPDATTEAVVVPTGTVLADVVQIPAVRVVKRVLVIFVGSAMDTIGAVAGGHLHLRAGRTGESVGVVGSDPKLLNAFYGGRDHRARGALPRNVVRIAFRVTGGITAIETEGVLVIQSARDPA